MGSSTRAASTKLSSHQSNSINIEREIRLRSIPDKGNTTRYHKPYGNGCVVCKINIDTYRRSFGAFYSGHGHRPISEKGRHRLCEVVLPYSLCPAAGPH